MPAAFTFDLFDYLTSSRLDTRRARLIHGSSWIAFSEETLTDSEHPHKPHTFLTAAWEPAN